MKVKNSAQTAKGYQYQSLYAAKLMLEALNGENEYEKFIIEADNTSIAESAIDDIVCYKANNDIDYYQVKHTDNTLEHSLNFEWLFGQKRNILEKMFKSYKKQIEKNKVNNIFLITTRKPDIFFEACLDKQGLLIYDNIDEENLTTINKLFGNDLDTFKNFLEVLKFKSTKNYDKLEDIIKSKLDSISSENDFSQYMRMVEQWSTNKDSPNKDGFVYKKNIRNAILKNKESLDQTFNIEQDYIELSDFSKSFKEKIQKNKLTVLYGDAGTGKSSFITNFLKNIKNHIRHYYFLSINQSNNIERINIKNIKESLKSQLKRISDEEFGDRDLKDMIELHDSNCDLELNPFYIVIDGIDHVYRNNEEDIRPLSDFIDFVLSLNLKNTKIIISTQMSDLDIYPDILLNNFPKKEWIEINKLKQEEVLQYVENQNFIIDDQLSIREISEILYKKIQGHPLLLHYIKEDLKKTKIVTKINLDKIQTCETIYKYYDYILSNMDEYEKVTLFLMSQYNFVWYNNYLNEIINLILNKKNINNEKKLQHNNIHFLFKKMFNNGFTFHHESLIGYIKEKNIIEKYKEKNCTEKLNAWVKDKSPEHIKNIWGNMFSIKENIFPKNIDYSWLAKRVSEGYPLVKLEELLNMCIDYSRVKQQYSEMHYFNSLLSRLKNDYNLFLDAEALIDIYSNCATEILFENLDIIYNNSLRNIYILAYAAKKRNDYDLLNHAKKKFYEYNNYLNSNQTEIDPDDVEKYYDFLYIMFFDVNDFKEKLPKKNYIKSKITQYNSVILDFRNVKEIENIYRSSSEDNKKQISLFLAFYYLKNNKKTKAMHFLFDVIKKDVCLETNTITIDDEDEKYFNLYFSYFMKCYYLIIEKGQGVDIKLLDNASKSIRYLSNDFKEGISSIINYIVIGNDINFENVFNSCLTKCNPREYYSYIKDKNFNEFKILISCLIHFCKKPKELLDMPSIKFLLDNNNVEKNSIIKLNDFLKIQIFDNGSISNIKNKIEEEFSLKIFENHLEGAENEYISLFRLLKNYDQNCSENLFYFCGVSLSYRFSKDINIYPLIYSLYYLSKIDEKNTLILLIQMLPRILHISDFTNLKELHPAVYLFNCLLDRLYLNNKVFLNSKDIENIEIYKSSKKSMFHLEDSKNACLKYKINERSSLSNEKPEKYLKNEDNWYANYYFRDDFFHYVDEFFHKNKDFEKKINSLINKLIYNTNSNIFPYHKLVYVFCKNENNIDALILTKMFVKIFIEETDFLNIPDNIL